MPSRLSHRIDAWDHCARELVARRCRFRLRRYDRSSSIYVCELVQGVHVREFSLAPLLHRRDEDVERARDLCLEGQRTRPWPEPLAARGGTSRLRWQGLVEACIADIEVRICKEGSRVHAINDLKLRVARFRDPADPQRLLSWAMEVNPLTHLKRFNHRIETISQIHRSGLMDLTAVLQQLRGMRPKGAAEKIRKASSMRVRVIPSDADLEHWLDRLEPFHQWVFACIAVFGLRPHELWHAEGIDDRGWISIPGDMKTKTSEHFAPAVPEAWLERYQLRQNWDLFHGQLNARWTVRFAEISSVRIAVNNVAVSNVLYKEFQHRGLQKLWAPRAEGAGMDWVHEHLAMDHGTGVILQHGHRIATEGVQAVTCKAVTPKKQGPTEPVVVGLAALEAAIDKDMVHRGDWRGRGLRVADAAQRGRELGAFIPGDAVLAGRAGPDCPPGRSGKAFGAQWPEIPGGR
nr:hypothetical protein [Synechococcus sp. CBW1002]